MPRTPVQVELPNGDVILADIPLDGVANVSSGARHLLDMAQLRKTVHGVTAALRAALDDLTPAQVQVEFGLELAAKSGKVTSLLAEVGATATVKVSLTWHGDSPPAVAVSSGRATTPAQR